MEEGRTANHSLSPAPSQDLPSSQSLSQSQTLDNSQNDVQNPNPPQISIEDLASAAVGSSPLGKDKDDQRKRYDNICRSLNVSEEAHSKAWEFISRIPTEDNTAEHETFWFACALYLAGSKRLTGTANGVSLSGLLRTTNIRMVDFFDPMKSFIALLKLGPGYEEQLKLLEKKFVVITILFQKYEKMFGDLMQLPTPTDRSREKGKKSDPFHIFLFGWCLFLVCKGKLLADPPDLVNAFHVLISVVNLLFVHVPSHFRKISFKDPALLAKSEGIPNGAINTLSYICDLNNANYSETSQIHEKLFVPFLQMLCKTSVLKVNTAKVPIEPALAKSFYLGGLLDNGYLNKNKNSITKEYEKMYYDGGDFDERLFIDQIEQIGTPSKVAVPTRNYYHLKPKGLNGSFNEEASLLSPSRAIVPPSAQKSPMSTTLATVSWLKDTVINFQEGPTEALLNFFKNCSKDVTSEIQDRISKLSATIKIPEESQNDWSEKPRIDLGIKLYYRILESMLLFEQDRLKQDNFTGLLTHDTFHKSLLACCIEIVLFSYKMTHMSFPYVIHQFHIQPFDFSKIIESVIRHAPELPKVVTKHLCNIEEKILESLAWEQNSSLIPLIKDKSNSITVPATNINTGILSPNINKPQGGIGFLSPMPNKTKAPNTPNVNANLGDQKKSKSSTLDLFFRKVFQLASIRTRELCSKLELSPKLSHQIWQALSQVITSPDCLMMNRHLDQIIMCCIYGVCRVNQVPGITFRAIIEQYRQQAQAHSKIFREVVLSKKDEKGDIISFYNSIFIPAMEQFLLQFQQNAEALNKENALTSPGRHLAPKSPQPNQNLYLSPMRPQLRSTTPSVHTPKLIYSFGESPARDLQQINQTLSASKAKKPIKRLFSEGGKEEMISLSESSLKRKFDELTSSQNGIDLEELSKQPRSD